MLLARVILAISLARICLPMYLLGITGLLETRY
jgi:hypothetical protein